MRILLQDGNIDVPYEQCGFTMFFNEIFSGNWDVNANIGGNKSYKMAEYSTEAKARKAMEMLQKAYCGNLFRYIDEFVFKAKNYDSRPELLKLLNGAVESVKYFQFPADDEVEVSQ